MNSNTVNHSGHMVCPGKSFQEENCASQYMVGTITDHIMQTSVGVVLNGVGGPCVIICVVVLLVAE